MPRSLTPFIVIATALTLTACNSVPRSAADRPGAPVLILDQAPPPPDAVTLTAAAPAAERMVRHRIVVRLQLLMAGFDDYHRLGLWHEGVPRILDDKQAILTAVEEARIDRATATELRVYDGQHASTTAMHQYALIGDYRLHRYADGTVDLDPEVQILNYGLAFAVRPEMAGEAVRLGDLLLRRCDLRGLPVVCTARPSPTLTLRHDADAAQWPLEIPTYAIATATATTQNDGLPFTLRPDQILALPLAYHLRRSTPQALLFLDAHLPAEDNLALSAQPLALIDVAVEAIDAKVIEVTDFPLALDQLPGTIVTADREPGGEG